jgi:hypothetical protein
MTCEGGDAPGSYRTSVPIVTGQSAEFTVPATVAVSAPGRSNSGRRPGNPMTQVTVVQSKRVTARYRRGQHAGLDVGQLDAYFALIKPQACSSTPSTTATRVIPSAPGVLTRI